MRTNRPLLVLSLLAASVLTSCAASIESYPIVADPKEAAIYINGEKLGTGNRNYSFDFSKYPRAVLQATAYGCTPHFEVWSRDRLKKHFKTFKYIEVTLKQER